MKIIGLTGTYCAGKNFVAGLLEKRGLPTVDVDKLGYQALEMEKAAVFARFGNDVANPDGSVNRRLLGQRTFGKPDEMAALEAIVHPVANRLTDEWIARQNGDCVINAALLHRCNAFTRLDFIILVNAPLLTRLRRAHKRDGLSWAQALRRFASQKQFHSQYISGNADIYKVENPGFKHAGDSSTTSAAERKLERKIDEILSAEGILKVWKT